MNIEKRKPLKSTAERDIEEFGTDELCYEEEKLCIPGNLDSKIESISDTNVKTSQREERIQHEVK